MSHSPASLTGMKTAPAPDAHALVRGETLPRIMKTDGEPYRGNQPINTYGCSCGAIMEGAGRRSAHAAHRRHRKGRTRRG